MTEHTTPESELADRLSARGPVPDCFIPAGVLIGITEGERDLIVSALRAGTRSETEPSMSQFASKADYEAARDDKVGEWNERRLNDWREAVKRQFVHDTAVDAIFDLALAGLSARSAEGRTMPELATVEMQEVICDHIFGDWRQEDSATQARCKSEAADLYNAIMASGTPSARTLISASAATLADDIERDGIKAVLDGMSMTDRQFYQDKIVYALRGHK